MSEGNNVLRAHLEAEVAASQKNAKTSMIMFAILVVFVIGYFMWLRAMLKEVMEPNALARVGITMIEDNLDPLINTMKGQITASFPGLVKNATEYVTVQALPQAGQYAKTHMDDQAENLGIFCKELGNDVFVSTLASAKDDITSQVRPPDTDGAARAEQVAASLEATVQGRMRTGFDSKMRACLPGDQDQAERPLHCDEESAAMKFQKASQALRTISAKLTQLANNDNPNREQQVQRRLIGAWWSFVGTVHAGGGANAAPGAADTAPAESAAP